MTIIDYAKWDRQVERLRQSYLSAEPFPSICLDNFLEPEIADRVWSEFPPVESKDWTHYAHVNERKLAQTRRETIPPTPLAVIDELNGPRFIAFLNKLSGIDRLLPDESLAGGGLHQTARGGFLNVHADFTSHPRHSTWARRVNVLIYFNKDWQESFGGHLQLWDGKATKCVRKILPVFNRCAIFSTSRSSFHGLPEPLNCPPGVTRKSIALYYFTEEAGRPLMRPTEYVPKPDDTSLQRILIRADNMALRTFDFAKRRLGVTDQAIGKVLRIFSKGDTG